MDLKKFVKELESDNDLKHIKQFVNTELQIAEIADRINKTNGPALLFENNGSNFPLLINAFASNSRICKALRVNNLDDIEKQIQVLLERLQLDNIGFAKKIKLLLDLKKVSSWMPKIKNGRGKCQQVVMSETNLNNLPILKCWPHDGGKFITLPLVHTKCPTNNIRNMGMYRMQVLNSKETGMHWHLHKGAARHYEAYKAIGKIMPVAVALGGDPIYTYVATAPLPENFDEYILAGFLRKNSVTLVRCLTQPLEVPDDVDFVIEGYVDPNEELVLEGPFGDHTGFYSLADYYPRFHVTCITHKLDAIYPTTIVGIPPQEDAFLGKVTEKLFLKPIQLAIVPEIIDMHMPIEGGFHNLTIVKFKKTYPGQAEKIANALWGAGQMMLNKFLILVDEDIDIHDYNKLIEYMFAKIIYPESFYFSKGPLDVLDHSSNKFAYGNKLAIDLTTESNNRANNAFISNGQLIKKDLINYETINNFEQCFNCYFIEKDLPIITIGIGKNFIYNKEKISNYISENIIYNDIKVLIFFENTLFMESTNEIAWRFLSNVDPIRDIQIKTNNYRTFPLIILDATNKTNKIDGVTRIWPNIVFTDEKTIKNVDILWEKLNLGPLIPSPSLKYQNVVQNNSAILNSSSE